MNKKKTLLIYAVGIAVPLLVGGLSAALTMSATETFSLLNRPPFSPPAGLFPLVWTVLYILMGIAAARIYLSASEKKERALFVFGVQLLFNFFWSIFFFNFRIFTFSAVWLALMCALIIYLMILAFQIDKVAAFLLIPYILWCLFALYLNIAIAILN